MDAGGLTQMSYNSFPAGNGLGVPGSGFAARRPNGSNVKHLSFEPTKPNEPADTGLPTPRTSRSHLLAGLRTAPKSPTFNNAPATAPPTQQQFNAGLAGSMYALQQQAPRTSGYAPQNMVYNNHLMIPGAEQVLAPPELPQELHAQEQMDPNLYAQLVATNMYLAEQQQRLQQQLLNVQAAAAQMQGLNLNVQGQFATPPVTPQNFHLYQQQQQQQVQQQMQPIISPVAGAQPGIYSYYNPLTGQQTYFVDNNAQSQYELPVMQNANYSPPQHPGTPRLQVSPPPNDDGFGSISPPNTSPPPQDVMPLPPPSASAFRRGHRKAESMAFDKAVDTSKSVPTTKAAPIINTPTTAGFGPGQARAGEHPIRQPRGPPPLEELMAKPTTKFDSSKNFAARTRRNALHNLVRAGMERRRAEGSMSPVSENEDNASSSGSGSLAGEAGPVSARTLTHGAIGSGRPSRSNSFERKSTFSMDSTFSSASVGSSQEDSAVGGTFAAVFKNGGKKPEVVQEKKAPMLVLTSTEKRKSSVF